VWTPNESREAIQKLQLVGVDAIMVDYPDAVKELLAEVVRQNKIKREQFAARCVGKQDSNNA